MGSSVGANDGSSVDTESGEEISLEVFLPSSSAATEDPREESASDHTLGDKLGEAWAV
jgi:hypothetical protein